MTSLSENDQKNEVSNDFKRCVNDNGQSLSSTDGVESIIQETTHDDDDNQAEVDQKRQSDDLTSTGEETNVVDGISNDDTLINTSPLMLTTDEEQQQKEATETTVSHDEDETQATKSSNSKVKYFSMPYHRPQYYTNGHPYGPASYYYYSVPTLDKPAPLMFLPTQQTSSSSLSPSSRDNQISNSTTVSPQNLPPRLRQTSTTETDSNSQSTSTAPTNSQISPSSTTTNTRRHRSILPRGVNNYYSPHPPPPLMATPPGVLYPYPPAVHQPGHIAYNIRTPDELELLAFQQQLMNFPPGTMLWPPHATVSAPGHPQFSPYPMNGLPPTYVFNNSTTTQQANSFLNPEAAEWVPFHNDNDVSSSSSTSDNHILIDDEINFPPLNSATNIKDHIEDNSEQAEISSEIISTNDNDTSDNTPVLTENSNILTPSNVKIELKNTLSSSQNDDNKVVPLLPNKITPMTYSTIISQSTENTKSNKNNSTQSRQQQSSTSHIHNQLPPRDRTVKQQQQRTQMIASSSNLNPNSRRRQPFNNNRKNTRNLLPPETNSLPKPQAETSDDWIEVRSKKTKKFDRNLNDSSSEKFVLDEQVHKSVSPPLSLTSTGDNTNGTFTSEDDYDEKDINHGLVIVMDTDTSNDYNQIIVNDIHNRLDNDERLLIIMRGCPGSGKSTLAKALNHGYNGVILSTDDYFTDNSSNKYSFDLCKLDDAHRYNRRRASDALKQNISPVIIDNTNTQAWEMRPYVAMGKEAGYDILLVEPQTPWRYKARELFKQNHHSVPIRRIREMLNRFEHNVTVQNIIDQLPTTIKNNNILSSDLELLKNKDSEILDPMLTSKKFYDIIDDSLILDDVRLCINDMILFLTSNFYQTTLLSSTLTLPTTTTTTTATTSQCSSPLSISFHDLSLISSSTSTSTSLPPTPSTPHSRFHRSLGRFPSTTTQDHSFNTEHILRLPTSAFPRCTDTIPATPPLSTQSSLIAKKRRKNKNKQQSNELLLNTNNNNNNMNNDEENVLEQQQQQTFNVLLPEDCVDFVVIDEQNDNDWIDNVNKNYGIQINSFGDHSSIISYQENQSINSKNKGLINIIHKEFNEPSYRPSISTKHIAIQCSSNDFNTDPSDIILTGHLLTSSTKPIITSSKPRLPGFIECGIQVDFNDNSDIHLLVEIYAHRLSSETIEHFYEVCQNDIQWARTQIDEYLQHYDTKIVSIPTLRQLCLNTLNQWNEQIKSIDPLFDTNSIDDLLQDINDDEILDDLTLNNVPTNVEYLDENQINIPWTLINSLEELYGEIPNKSFLSSNSNSVSLPFDHDLSISIYQALQRFLIQSNQTTTTPVIENSVKKENKKKQNNNNNPKWKLPSDNQSNLDSNTSHVPSLKQIINEEQQAAKARQSKQKRQLDYATEHKFKELQRHFPSFDTDLLYDIFHENEYNYDITFICISTMLNENASIITTQPSSSVSSSRSMPRTKIVIEPVLESYEILRHDVFHHAQQRKEFYTKAHQANRHGMSGVASFYIHRASEETQLMKDANRAACERLSQWRLAEYQRTNRLDLHGLHSGEALNLFKRIEEDFNEGNRRTTPKSIEIITGYGKNSAYGGGYGKLRSVILTYLQQRHYKYSEPNKGVILLHLTNIRN